MVFFGDCRFGTVNHPAGLRLSLSSFSHSSSDSSSSASACTDSSSPSFSTSTLVSFTSSSISSSFFAALLFFGDFSFFLVFVPPFGDLMFLFGDARFTLEASAALAAAAAASAALAFLYSAYFFRLTTIFFGFTFFSLVLFSAKAFSFAAAFACCHSVAAFLGVFMAFFGLGGDFFCILVLGLPRLGVESTSDSEPLTSSSDSSSLSSDSDSSSQLDAACLVDRNDDFFNPFLPGDRTFIFFFAFRAFLAFCVNTAVSNFTRGAFPAGCFKSTSFAIFFRFFFGLGNPVRLRFFFLLVPDVLLERLPV